MSEYHPDYPKPILKKRKVKQVNNRFDEAARELKTDIADTKIPQFIESNKKKLPKASLEAIDDAITVRFGIPEARIGSDEMRVDAIVNGLVMGGLLGLHLPRKFVRKTDFKTYFTDFARDLAISAQKSPYDLEDMLERNSKDDMPRIAVEQLNPRITNLFTNPEARSTIESQRLYISALGCSAATGLVLMNEAAIQHTLPKVRRHDQRVMRADLEAMFVDEGVLDYDPHQQEPPADVDRP